MKRLVVFFATVAVVATALMWLNWWVDPLGDYYDNSATARGLDFHRPCLISDDVIGAGSWWRFKRDVYRRLAPKTVVIGTSRVLQLRAHPRERDFANLGLPGTSVPMLVSFLEDLHAVHPGPLTLYLGIELFWLNANWAPPYFYSPPGKSATLRDLMTRQRLGGTITLIAQRPSVLFRRWHIGYTGGQCVIDSGNRAAKGEVGAWAPDGSLWYPHQVRKDLPREPPPDDFGRDLGRLEGPHYLGGYYTNWNRLSYLDDLGKALALARRYRWAVVGFVPPYSTRYVRRLSTAAQTASRWREFTRVVPRLFTRYGETFVDSRWVREIPCPDNAFVDDGWHPDLACSTRLRAILDAAAHKPPRAYASTANDGFTAVRKTLRMRLLAASPKRPG